MAQLCRISRMVAPAHTALPLTLLLSMEAYRLQRELPLGRQSAGAGLLEAYLRYGGNRDHQLVVWGKAMPPGSINRPRGGTPKLGLWQPGLMLGEMQQPRTGRSCFLALALMNGPGSACPGATVPFPLWE